MTSGDKLGIKEQATYFIRQAKEAIQREEAKPAICYHFRDFKFIEDIRSGNPYPRGECIFNRESLHELVTEYTETMAIFIMSETLEYILMEKEIFNK